MNGLITEASMLANAAAEGRLDVAANDTVFQGKYRDIIQGMNRTLKSFASPINDIGDVLQRLARKLAERANQAAGKITSLIKESTQQVEKGAQLSDETGDALKKIVEGVEATAAKISEIAAATVQQSGNAEEVSRAVQGIAQVTEQAAAGSEQMASSSQELGAQAQALRDLVSKFTTGSGGSAMSLSGDPAETAA